MIKYRHNLNNYSYNNMYNNYSYNNSYNYYVKYPINYDIKWMTNEYLL